MKPTITLDIPADSEPLVRQLLALHDELNALALAAPAGTVLDACETSLLAHGRDLHTALLTHAVAQRLAAVEKKGPRSASAPVAAPRKTAARPTANSSPPSASSR